MPIRSTCLPLSMDGQIMKVETESLSLVVPTVFHRETCPTYPLPVFPREATFQKKDFYAFIGILGNSVSLVVLATDFSILFYYDISGEISIVAIIRSIP